MFSLLVLYYTFENGSGATVTDRSNAGNNLDGGFTGAGGTPDWDGTNKKRGSYSMNFATCEGASSKVSWKTLPEASCKEF